MAISDNFLRHTLLWNLSGGEKAACSFYWRPSGDEFSLDTDLQAVFAERGSDLWGAIKSRYAVETEYVGSKLQLLSPAGAVLETANMSETASGGDTFVSALPSEVAVVASLLSTVGTRRGRGRVYLPAPHRDLCVSGGRLLAAARADLALAVARYCDAFVDSGTDFFSVVYSRTGAELNAIANVRVGDVFDSQRRRRDKLTEVVTTEPVDLTP